MTDSRRVLKHLIALKNKRDRIQAGIDDALSKATSNDEAELIRANGFSDLLDVDPAIVLIETELQASHLAKYDLSLPQRDTQPECWQKTPDGDWVLSPQGFREARELLRLAKVEMRTFQLLKWGFIMATIASLSALAQAISSWL